MEFSLRKRVTVSKKNNFSLNIDLSFRIRDLLLSPLVQVPKMVPGMCPLSFLGGNIPSDN